MSKRRNRKKSAIQRIILIMFLMFLLLPFAVLLLWSFCQSWPADSLLPAELGLRGWKYLFSPSGKMLASLGLSVFISLTVTVLGLILSIPAGKALGLFQFPGKKFIEVLLLVPIIIPALTVGMGIHMAFIRYNLTDRLLGVILVQLPLVLPYGIRVFAGTYQALGLKWAEQAQMLKANRLQTFRYVMLPFLSPGLASAAILMFNVSFSQYFLTYLIGGGKVVTLPLLLFPFVNSGDRVVAAGLSLVFILTALIFMFLVEKGISRNLERNFYYF
jgi:putative spermidine/putrescine transport system permease protein